MNRARPARSAGVDIGRPAGPGRLACEEPLLLWAVRSKEKRTFVHIGMLGASERGAACQCLCRGCQQPLIAVNVDKPASHFDRPGTQRKHFKHHQSQSEAGGCMAAVARLVALQLFVEQDVIVLPPHTRTLKRRTPLQTDILVVQQVPAATVRVQSRVWIDETSARIVLEDGRELLVTVSARHSVDEDRNTSCVLSLRNVSDPDIASWDTQKILEHLRLPGCGLEWDSHWDDKALKAREVQDLSAEEDMYLAGIPPEMLENLDGRQASETILHWLIKRAITEHSVMRVPALEQAVEQKMPDGTTAREIAHSPAVSLRLSDVELEYRLGPLVPDVYARAQRLNGSYVEGPVFELMIEAAVTHYVNETKRAKIVASRTACLQIRADLFSRAGMVHAKDIEALALAEATNKEWILHPWFADSLSQARRRLNARAETIKKRMAQKAAQAQEEEQHREVTERIRKRDVIELKNWLKRATDHQLATVYARALMEKWAGKPQRLYGTAPVDASDAWAELERRQIVTTGRSRLEYSSGLLPRLVGIRDQAGKPDTSGHLAALELAKIDSHTGTALTILVALQHYPPAFTAAEQARYKACAQRLHEAVANGDAKVTRFTAHDGLWSLLLPKMRQDLASDFGTEPHLEAMQAERRQRENAEREEQEQQRAQQAAAERQHLLQERQIFQQDLQKVILAATQGLNWLVYLGDAQTPALLYGRFKMKARLQTIDSMALFEAALEARTAKRSVADALQALPFRNFGDVRAAVELLCEARVCC